MKKMISFSLAAAMAAGQTFAANPVPGWYGGLLLTASAPQSVNFTSNVFAHTLATDTFTPFLPLVTPTILTPLINGKLQYRIMGGGGGQLGYRFMNCLRGELELLYNTNSFSKLTIHDPNYTLVIKRTNSNNSTGRLGLQGATTVIAGFINGYYEFFSGDTESNFVPFIGLGIGYANVRSRLSFWYNNNIIPLYSTNGTRLASSTLIKVNNVPAGQFIIGGSYFLDDFTSIGLDYRYISTTNISEFNKRYALNTINFTMNFAFDSIMS